MARQRYRWRPPAQATHGICPRCRQWVELTPGRYIKDHRFIMRDGNPVGAWKSGAVVLPEEKVIRCSGVGRDPLWHECIPPEPHGEPGGTWACSCGLRYMVLTVPGVGLSWSRPLAGVAS